MGRHIPKDLNFRWNRWENLKPDTQLFFLLAFCRYIWLLIIKTVSCLLLQREEDDFFVKRRSQFIFSLLWPLLCFTVFVCVFCNIYCRDRSSDDVLFSQFAVALRNEQCLCPVTSTYLASYCACARQSKSLHFSTAWNMSDNFGTEF